MARGGPDWSRLSALWDGENIQTLYETAPVVRLAAQPALVSGSAVIGNVNPKYYPTTPTASYYNGSAIAVGAGDATKTDTIVLATPFWVKHLTVRSTAANTANYYKIERYDSGDVLVQTLVLKAYDQATAEFPLKIPIACDANDYLKITYTNDAGIATTLIWNMGVLWTGTVARGTLISSNAITAREWWGLGWDGTQLWSCDDSGNDVYTISVSTWADTEKYATQSASPKGLDYYNGSLWETTDAPSDRFYKVDPSDGSQEDMQTIGTTTCFDCVHDGTYLWVSDHGAHKIFQINPTDGATIDSFNSPANSPRGIAHDGTFLWIYCDADAKIYICNPTDMNVIDSFAAPSADIRGMAHTGTYLYAIDWAADQVHVIQG